MVSNHTDHHGDRFVALAAACFLSVIAIITTVANGVLLLALIFDPLKQLRAPPMYFISNLAVADLLNGVLVDTLHVMYNVSFYHGNPNGSAKFVGNLVGYVSVNSANWITVALVCERYLCIKKPYRYHFLTRTRNIVIASCFIWIYSIMFSLILFTENTDHHVYRLAETYLNLSIPLLIITVLLYQIYIFLRNQKYNDILRFQPSQNSRRKELLTKAKQDKRMMNTVIFILVMLFACFVPYVVFVHIRYFYPNYDSLPYDLFNRFSEPLVYLNSGINPFIYAWRHRVFRKSIQLVFCKNTRNSVGEMPSGSSRREIVDVNGNGSSPADPTHDGILYRTRGELQNTTHTDEEMSSG